MELKVTSSDGCVSHNTLLKQLQDSSSETGITFPHRALDPCSLLWNIKKSTGNSIPHLIHILNTRSNIKLFHTRRWNNNSAIMRWIFKVNRKFYRNWMWLLVIYCPFKMILSFICSCSKAISLRCTSSYWAGQSSCPAKPNGRLYSQKIRTERFTPA